MAMMTWLRLPARQRRADADPWQGVQGADPYADGKSITEALAMAPEEEPPRVPSFTPAARPPVPTAPQPALHVPPEAMGGQRDPRDRDVLERVLRGLKGLGEEGGNRGREFASDFRSLPLFRQVARSKGWCGLPSAPPAFGWEWWTVERWEAQARAAIDAAFRRARSDADEQAGRVSAEIRMELDEWLSARTGGAR